MYRFLEYGIFFIILVLLQVFLFDNLNLGLYVRPLVYIAFIILLPFKTGAAAAILCGLAIGGAMDLLSGGDGLNIIASVATGLFRTAALRMTTTGDTIREGGSPSAHSMGAGSFLGYCSVMVLVHCFIFFSFEALSWSYYWLTVLRIIASAAVTLILLMAVRLLLPSLYVPRVKNSN